MATVDVIIATRDRPAALRRSLAALEGQTRRDFGVIVVDDGSTPPVDSWLKVNEFPALDLRILSLAEHGGPARARNAGIEASTADYIAFIDDDVEAERHLLERHLQVAEQDHDAWIVSVGPMSAPPQWKPTLWTLWEWRQLEKEYDRLVGGEYSPTWRQLHTGNALVPRAALEAVGGFDVRFTRAEDIELGLRLSQAGAAFRFTPSAVAWHSPERTLRSWRQVAEAYGRFDIAIDRLHPEAGWLETLRQEAAGRSRLLRTARVVLGVRVLRAPSIGLLSAASRVAGAMGWTRAGLAGLSLVYALEYDRGRKAGRAGSAWTGSVEGEPARERSADVAADSTEGPGPSAEGEQAASEHSPAGTTNRNGPGHPSPALAGSRADGGSASGR